MQERQWKIILRLYKESRYNEDIMREKRSASVFFMRRISDGRK